MSDEVNDRKFQWDPIHLYTRTDEKYEDIRLIVETIDKAQRDLNTLMKKIEERVEKSISFGTHKNTERIGEIDKATALLAQDIREIKDQLFNEKTGLFTQFADLRNWVSTINKTVAVFFIVSVAGGLILWAIQKFH